MILFKIAWKNVWRNKLRSAVVCIAIALGLLAGTFASAFVQGMMKQKIESVIAHEISHFQFHHQTFREEFALKSYLPNGENIQEELKNNQDVVASTGRVIGMVMFASANQNGAIKAIGISPEEEKNVTALNTKIIEGAFFEGIKRNPILVSKKTAEKYHLQLRSKVVLTFQNLDGEMVAAAFRVAGIFDSKNGLFDEMNVFVRKTDFAPLLGLPEGSLHEIAVKLSRNELAETTAAMYQKKHPDLEVLSWLDLGLGMRNMIEMQGSYTSVVVGIILVALLFSILNTMLMAVLERTKEIGMLMAIGMSKGKIFKLILYETIFLSAIGTPVGLFLASSLITHFGQAGIDLGDAAYEDMGMANVIYPALSTADYLQVVIMVVVMSLVAAIYPAKKALSLKPIEAIRS